MGILSEYLIKRFGIDLVAEFPPFKITISTTPTEIVKSNPDRLQITFMNLSANVVYLGVDETVSVGNGLYLDSNGGSITLLAEEDGDLVGYSWYGVAGASSDIYVIAVKGK